MQKAIDCWQGVAKTTGGALEPSKSWWYLIHFAWKNGNWSYESRENMPEDIILSAEDKDNNRTNLKYLESSQSQQMLGVYLSPDGNNKAQFDVMMEKTSHYGEMIRTGHIHKHEAWIALKLIAMKSIEYALPALTLTKQQYTKIMWPLLRFILPRAGINRNIHRSILYGPVSKQGLGLRDPFLLQGIYHIRDIQEHIWKDTPTGQFFKINLEQLRLEIGSNVDIFQADYKKFAPIILTSSLVQNTWQFISDHNITMLYNIDTFPLRRIGDRIIMDEILSSSIKGKALKSINKCRIYLQALTLSDLTTGDGKYITNDAFIGRRRCRQVRYNYQWPNWGQPSYSDWQAWRKALKLVFAPRWHRKLQHSLGSWTEQLPSLWEWFETSEEADLLFQQTSNQRWIKYSKLGRSRRVKRYKLTGQDTTDPRESLTLLPTTISMKSNCIETEGTSPTLNLQPENIQTHITPSWLHYKTTQSPCILQVIRDINNGTARAVSDGSFFSSTGIGTAAWTIESNNEKEYITGTSIVPGPSSIQSAYRSELTGILAILEKLRLLCLNHNITEGSITLSCDGISALSQSLSRHFLTHSSSHLHSDILSTASKLVHNLPIKIFPSHVKGHQDDHIKYSQLNRPAQLNTKMDMLAKETALQQHESYDNAYTSHHMAFFPIFYGTIQVQHQTIDMLYDHISGDIITSYWISKNRFSSTTKDLIHWFALEKAMDSLDLTKKRFITKWSSNNMGTGHKLVQWKFRHKGNCPFCMEENEDVPHLLQCRDNKAIRIWNESLWDYITKLHKIQTCNKAIIAIMKELQAWREGTQVPPLDHLPNELVLAVNAQRIIGWKQFLEGLIAKEWIEYQQQYYSQINSKKQGLNWSIKMIKAHVDLLQRIWTGRNKQLHETNKIQELEGLPELLASIRTEWDIGISVLPAVDFSHLFSTDLQALLRKHIDSQKDWLAVIKLGRRLHNDPNINNDGFSVKGPLSRWIGITDDDWMDNSS